MKPFKSLHNLPFETKLWELFPFLHQFIIGTCHGLWQSTDTTYDIISIINDNPGNGHLNDVFEWFEHSCKRDKKDLRVLEVMNDGFFTHLINKRGFTGTHECLIKVFK